jgi:3-dehydroquinate synthetase
MKTDVEENENGSRRILRGGHDFSDRLEEDLKLNIPHGIAVAIGIVNQLEMEQNNEFLDKAIKLFDLLDIPCSIASYNKWA